MFRLSGADIFSGFIVFLVIFIFGLILFLYVGLIALFIFLGIGVGIAAVYAIVVYIKSFVAAVRTVGGGGVHSLWDFLRNWVRLIGVASQYAFKENLAVASNALNKSQQYKFLSPRRWMWFIVAPAAVVFGTAVIIAVIGLQFVIFLALAGLAVLAMVAYVAIAFLFACGYAIGFSIKNTDGNDVRSMFTFNFTLSAKFADLGAAMKQYFVGLWATVSNVFRENLSMGQSNKSFATNYKIIQPQYVFLIASFIALPFIAVIYSAILMIVAAICFLPIVLANLIWTPLAKFIDFIR